MSPDKHAQEKYTKRSWNSKSASEITSASEILGLHESFVRSVLDHGSSNYHSWEVPKSSGGKRKISAPNRSLRKVQTRILRLLYRGYRSPHFLHGGLPKKSIFTLAQHHSGKHLVMWVDISQFFPSITDRQVCACFRSLGFTDSVAHELAQLSTLDGALPQGGITSSMLANAVGLEFDDPILRMTKKKGLSYGRFIDDAFISGDFDFKELKGPLCDRIREAGFTISPKVTDSMFMYRHQPQVVCGLLVNSSIRPTNDFIARTGKAIDLCLSEDYLDACELLECEPRKIKSKINGLVQFMMQSESQQASVYRRRLYGVDWQACRNALTPCA